MRFNTFIFAIILFGSLNAWGQSDLKPVKNVNEVTDKLAEVNKKITSLQSNFTQEKVLLMLEKPIKSQGKFFLQSPDKLVWQYTSPFNYSIVMNGSKILIDNDGQKSTFDTQSNKVFYEISTMMTGLMRGDIVNSDDYALELMEMQKQYYAKLTPRAEAMQQYIKFIHLYFNKESLLLQSVKMEENTGEYTYINFEDQKINEPIAASIFSVN